MENNEEIDIDSIPFEEEKAEPNYYAIIPANVRYSRISPSAKLMYGEITALSNREGYCWASNRYFAGLYGVSIRSVSTWISELSQHGFIKCEVLDNYRRKIYLTDRSKLTLNLSTGIA